MNADVIIIGAGLAGIIAARSALEQGAKVLLLARKTVGLASNSAISNGVFTGPTSSYTVDAYMQDTFFTGKKLNNFDHLKVAAQGIGPAMNFLRDAGCKIIETHGHYIVKPSRPDVIPGLTLMKNVAASVKGLQGLTVQVGFHATDIIKHNGRVLGIRGLDKAGRNVKLYAPSVILACGGAGAIYLRNDNQKRALGQGYAMALRAGLELRDMEFVQFYPFVLAENRIPSMLLYPPVPKGARLINAKGEDLAAKYGLGSLNEMILKKRDDLSALLQDEMLSGSVYMDYRDVSTASWAHPPLAMLGKLNFDFKHKPFAVAPGAHFFMGGIQTDPETQTELPGLFACGEVAWGLHGANRRGGNALTECMVFGQIAGLRAARWGLSHPLLGHSELKYQSNHQIIGHASSLSLLRIFGRKIRELAWTHAGIRRSGEYLRTGLEMLREIETNIKGIEPATVAEFTKKEDQLGACLVLRAILVASLARQESVGSFKRKDFPEEQDQSIYGNSCVRYNVATEQVSVSFLTYQNEK